MMTDCGECINCVHREKNRDVHGWKCIAYSFAAHLIENILECDKTLTWDQVDAMKRTVKTIKEMDAALPWEGL